MDALLVIVEAFVQIDEFLEGEVGVEQEIVFEVVSEFCGVVLGIH